MEGARTLSFLWFIVGFSVGFLTAAILRGDDRIYTQEEFDAHGRACRHEGKAAAWKEMR